ncbi:MAG: signal peptidase II [Candidatus Gracilibacteria bacterium]
MIYIIIITGIILDLFTKNLANIYLQDKINILGDILFLKYTKNTGIAFSINVPFLKLITIILIIGIFYYYFKEEKKKNNKLIDLSFGLILAGAIGNGIERIINSNVIDFIGVQSFAIFNLADSFITIGAIIYLYILYKNN